VLISEAKLFELISPYIDGLELLVKAGKVPPQTPWMQMLGDGKAYFLTLAQRLQKPLDIEEPKTPGPPKL
jgi:hypothetical protein